MHLITTQARAGMLAGEAAASDGEWRSIGQVADAVVERAVANASKTGVRVISAQWRRHIFSIIAAFHH